MKLTAHSAMGLIVALIMSSQVFANASTAVSTSGSLEPTRSPVFSGFVQASRSTSLVDFQDGTHKDGMDYTAYFLWKLSKDYSIGTQAIYSQDINSPEGSDFADTLIVLSRKPTPLGKTILLGWKVGAVAPTSKDSYKRQNLQGGALTGVTAMVNPDRLIPGLAIAGGVSITKNFHQYDTATNGAVNSAWSSTQRASITYDFAGSFTISAELLHLNALTYQDNIKESYQHIEEFGYQFNKTISAAIGHTNSGSALKANGTDSNYALWDENTSMVYVSLTAAF